MIDIRIKSHKGRALCDKLSASLKELPENDLKRVYGSWIFYLIATRQCRLKEAEYDFLLNFEDPLGYLIKISQIDEHEEIFNKKISYRVRISVRNAIRDLSK